LLHSVWRHLAPDESLCCLIQVPMLLAALVLVPFLGSLLAAVMPADARNRESWLAIAVAAGGLLMAGSLYPDVAAGQVLREELAWLPAQGLYFVLRVDGLAWVFTMLVLAIGLLVVVYARYYMSPADPVPRFFAFLLAFMGSMLGVVLSGNLVQLVVFWELTSLTSFLLIGYWHHRADARRGARMAFTVTATGGLCLLAGVLVLGNIVGSYDLDVVLAAGERIRADELYLPALVLIALGALTKSAQFPFHFWLPHAMAAPTPVSSYLHSATMVKAGVFLLVRLWPALAGTPEWTWIIGGAGVCTLLIGAFIAIFQHDLKGLLAYSTISHLGLITTLIGIGTPLAIVAAIFHILNHATFKASLFMAAGIIDHETGTRDMRVLSGLRHALPVTATLAIVASAAMAGVPLLNGFLSKEMFFAETLLVGGDTNWWMSYAALAMGVFGWRIRCASSRSSSARPARRCPRPTSRRAGCASGRAAGADLPGGGRAARPQHRACPARGGRRDPRPGNAGIRPGGVARLQHPAADEHARPGRRRAAVRAAAALPAAAERDTVPLVHRLNGAQIYENTMLRLTRGAGWLKHLGTQRLQPQLLLLMLALLGVPLLLAGAPPAWSDSPRQGFDPLFAAIWVIGGAARLSRRGWPSITAWRRWRWWAARASSRRPLSCGCRRPTWR
jgi:multicomponent K+:H+ antiporter subunit A